MLSTLIIDLQYYERGEEKIALDQKTAGQFHVGNGPDFEARARKAKKRQHNSL